MRTAIFAILIIISRYSITLKNIKYNWIDIYNIRKLYDSNIYC